MDPCPKVHVISRKCDRRKQEAERRNRRNEVNHLKIGGDSKDELIEKFSKYEIFFSLNYMK